MSSPFLSLPSTVTSAIPSFWFSYAAPGAFVPHHRSLVAFEYLNVRSLWVDSFEGFADRREDGQLAEQVVASTSVVDANLLEPQATGVVQAVPYVSWSPSGSGTVGALSTSMYIRNPDGLAEQVRL